MMFMKLKYPKKFISTFKRYPASEPKRNRASQQPFSYHLAFQRPVICQIRAQTTKRPWKENRSCITTSFQK